MTSTIEIQNVSGTNSNIGFFFTNHPDTNPVTNGIQIGWYAQGEGVFNGKVTDINIANETITIENQLFKSGQAYYFTSYELPYPMCFKKDTKILCFKENKEIYIPIQNVKKNDLIKTSKNGYLRVNFIGKSIIQNPSNNKRTLDRLYKCSKENYPNLIEDLFITGGHSILVDSLTEIEKQKTNEIWDKLQKTDDKYRLMVSIDEKSEPYQQQGEFTIYHIALENQDHYGNYGIYANGLLVETCSLICIAFSNMTLLEN
jgi:sporulation protein YlmC with PRC-barrel domain